MILESRRVELRGELADLNKSIADKREKAEALRAEAKALAIADDADDITKMGVFDQRQALREDAKGLENSANDDSGRVGEIRGTLARETVLTDGRERPSAFTRFCAKGYKGLDKDEKDLFAGPGSEDRPVPASAEVFRLNLAARQRRRAQNVSFKTGTEGAGLQAETVEMPEHRLKSFGAVSRIVRQMRTANGDNVKFPYFDDTANTGAALAEGAAAAEKAIPPANATVLTAYDLTSGWANVQLQAERDNPSLGGIVEAMLMRRIGRQMNDHLTKGAGNDAPLGIMTAATDAVTTAASRKIGLDDLIDCVGAFDPAYLEEVEGEPYGYRDTGDTGMVGWMMSWAARTHLMKELKDSDNKPFWIDARSGAPAMLLGFPVEINNLMDGVAANLHPVAFGSFNTYVHRIIEDAEVYRVFGETGITNKSARYNAWAAHDGSFVEGLVDASVATRNLLKSEAVQRIKVKA